MNRDLNPQIGRAENVIAQAAQHKQSADAAMSATQDKQHEADAAHAEVQVKTAAAAQAQSDLSAAQTRYDGLKSEADNLRAAADASVQRAGQSAIAGSKADHALKVFRTCDEIETKLETVGVDPEPVINLVLPPAEQELAEAESLLIAPLPGMPAPSGGTLPGTGAPGMPA